ncbi:glycoside hydrolase superfamily [Hypoxylon sp. FL1857]|nr:glycoside hydrolase superfamily [Hypoxylon sp. FL1857]
MQLKNSVVVAALSVSSAFATYTKDYKLNAYWGQSGPDTDTLAQHCASDSIDYITLGFVNNSPENGNGTGYPGTNFAAHCAAEVYTNNNRNSKLLSSCSFIKEDIKTCQRLGKKVLLSVGGVYSASSNYTLSSVQSGLDFAEFLYQAFGPYKSTYHGPRPFDTSSTDHTSLDGFDFDIEKKFADQQPYVHMVNHLRELIHADGKDMILTAAPQCPQSDDYFQMKTILQQAQFDKIWVQFYNNPICNANSPTFNYDDWETFIKGGVNAAAELFIGLPGSQAAVGLLGSGYITGSQAKDLICSYKTKQHFGGAMIWDAYYASQNTDPEGNAFHDIVSEALRCGGCAADVCPPAATSSSVTTSSATTSSSSSSTSSTVSTTSTSSSASTTSSSVSSTSSSTSSTSSSASSTSSSTSSSASSTSTSTSSSSSATTSSSASSSSSFDPSTSSSVSSTASETCTDSTSSSYIATSTSSVSASTTGSSSTVSTITSSSTESTTSSVSYSASTTSSDEDECTSDEETSSSFTESATYSVTATTTESQSAYPTTTSSGYATATASSSLSGYPTESKSITSSPYPTGSSSAVQYTTSTAYTTTVYTVTSCAPTVTICPARGSVVTETIALYTTVCPVTETEGQKPTGVPTYSNVPVTTSTIYSTRIATITKCPASVTNCPVGHLTTETVAIATIVVPVTVTVEKTPATSATYPAGGNAYEASSPSSKPVQAAAASSYSVAGSDSGSGSSASSPSSSSNNVVYVPTTMSVAVYPTSAGSSNNNNGTLPTYSTGTGYPVAPTTTSAGSGYTAVVCNESGCSAAYPTTSSIVTAGSAKTASLSLGLLAVVAFVL